jgi:hypothetical protein
VSGRVNIARWREELADEAAGAEGRRAFAATFSADGGMRVIEEKAAATRDDWRNRLALVDAAVALVRSERDRLKHGRGSAELVALAKLTGEGDR